jgi:hypothetical protein
MWRVLLAVTVLGQLVGARAGEVVQVGPWELHSSFWMSLHQTLIADAMSNPPRVRPELTAEELLIWNEAVGAYRTAGGRGDMTFATPMQITTDGLTQVADEATEPLIDAPLKDALTRAAAIYRRYWWADDDRASRFFIGYAAGMLREAGDALVKAHEKVYGTPWPQRIRAYVTPAGGPFGAYTMNGKAGGVITTMSCRDAGYQGFRALEMLLHESSHAIVSPSRGVVGGAITTSAKQHGIEPPRDLWHAILFATSGELTRRLLTERGISGFVPSSEELLTRAWPKYREPIEKNWYPYLSGQGTLEQAIDKIVAAIQK